MKIKVTTEEGIEGEAELSQNEKSEEGLGKYVIVRATSAGVFAGYLESKDKNEVILKRARRLWYWEGANTLSQLAMEGVSKPENCKFPCAVDSITILGVIEIIETTSKAKKSIQDVKVWRA
jgi:hypothetical protein